MTVAALNQTKAAERTSLTENGASWGTAVLAGALVCQVAQRFWTCPMPAPDTHASHIKWGAGVELLKASSSSVIPDAPDDHSVLSDTVVRGP